MKTAALFVVLTFLPTASALAAGGNPHGGAFAKAHPRRNEVNQRIANQRARINQGVKNGQLTEQQARQLRANDNAIKAQERAEVKANGGSLTKAEQKQLNQEENANSQLIYDEKHPASRAQRERANQPTAGVHSPN